MYVPFIFSFFWLARGKRILAVLHRSNLFNLTGNLEYGDTSPLLQLSNPYKPVTISCKSFSIPRWFKGSHMINRKGITISRSEHISSLTLTSTRVVHSGVYKCVGTNDNGARFEAQSKLVVAGNRFS